MKLTLDYIESLIEKEEYTKLGNKTCACIITLNSGFEVVGTSACVDPADYDETIGGKYARARALDKIWEVEGYRNQVENYEADMAAELEAIF